MAQRATVGSSSSGCREGKQRDARGKRQGVGRTVQLHRDRHPGGSVRRHQPFQVEGRHGWLVRLAEQADGSADRVETLARYALRCLERHLCGGWIRAKQPAGTAHVQHDHGQRMCDEVVHVAGEPVPLLTGRGRRQFGVGEAQLVAQPCRPSQQHTNQNGKRTPECKVDNANVPFRLTRERGKRQANRERREHPNEPALVGAAGEAAAGGEVEEDRAADSGADHDRDHGDDSQRRKRTVRQVDARHQQCPRHQRDRDGRDDEGMKLLANRREHRSDEGNARVDEIGASRLGG